MAIANCPNCGETPLVSIHIKDSVLSVGDAPEENSILRRWICGYCGAEQMRAVIPAPERAKKGKGEPSR